MSQAILEVIDGPMDGLNTVLAKSGMIGRSVGTVLSLALDLEVSGRHCEIVLEGPTWCLRDQGSTNGTWFKSERLAAGHSYPIPYGQIFLVGSTVVQLYKGAVDNPFIAVMDPGIKDPRKEYPMAEDLLRVWGKLISVPEAGDYCDTSRLFLALVAELYGEGSGKYDCVNQVNSSSKYRILDSWLLNASFEPYHQMVPKALTIAPRVWRLLDMAAKNTDGEFGINDLIKAILEEGRSIAGRHLARDFGLLEAIGLIPAGSTSGRSASGQGQMSSENVASDKQGQTFAETYTPMAVGSLENDARSNFCMRIELLVRGFLEDAANPVAGQAGVQIPGLQRSLQDILTLPDQGTRNQAIQEHLDVLYSFLVAVLASQREGANIFGKKLTQMIDRTIASSQGQQGTLLSLGKKIDPADVANSIRGALAKAESSGLNERIVRKVLIDKIKKFGMGG